MHIYLSLQQYQTVGFISAFLSATSVEQTRGQSMVGKCNLTAFSGGGMKCQREMIMALKDNASCRLISLFIKLYFAFVPTNTLRALIVASDVVWFVINIFGLQQNQDFDQIYLPPFPRVQQRGPWERDWNYAFTLLSDVTCSYSKPFNGKRCSWSLIWQRGPLPWFKGSITLTFLSLPTIA